MWLMHSQAFFLSRHTYRGSYHDHYLSHGYSIFLSSMPCSNHVVINAPKRGRLKVQVALILYFGVMTMWLVELISVTKVYLRILVPSAS